jgi:predicted ABC-type transport system involved in lysophospholipase L1 biosynthesis ATPase subunit
MSEPFLSARGLGKTYRLGRADVSVLCGVDLNIQRGELVAILGASGSGKSTLLNLLGGLDRPTDGEVRLEGVRVDTLSAPALARLRRERIGFVFQSYHLLPELDALENVCLPARLGRASAAQAEARGRELLARVGLGARVDHKPYELSGGEQQRVAIARALINRPHLILADEPTGNLDSHMGAAIIDLLCALREELDATLVIATHDLRIAERAPRVLRLVDGALAQG